MKSKMLVLLAVVTTLSGCATFRSNTGPKFPNTSTVLITPCPELALVPEGTTKLSTLEETVSDNYTKYHQCANQVNGWIEWYNKEKQNYDEAGAK